MERKAPGYATVGQAFDSGRSLTTKSCPMYVFGPIAFTPGANSTGRTVTCLITFLSIPQTAGVFFTTICLCSRLSLRVSNTLFTFLFARIPLLMKVTPSNGAADLAAILDRCSLLQEVLDWEPPTVSIKFSSLISTPDTVSKPKPPGSPDTEN
eukprot:m.68809 g.68809  ORF g.68809 m.68809 type:complete len:153 (-) comp9939_c0_seq1:2069-2527(-)